MLLNNPKNGLYHHGIKGMKWGVRRYKNKDGSLTKASRNRQIKNDRKRAVKNRRSMSDEELRRGIERLKMEKQYKDLLNEDLSPGRSMASDILKSSGGRVAKSVVTGAALYGIKALMTKEFNIGEMARYMTPKPKK